MEKLIGKNKSLNEQIKILTKILQENEKLWEILEILSTSKLKNYYVAAGSINQTVFNYYHNYELSYGIKDYDIVYFDSDLSYEKEDETIKYLESLLKDLDVSYDIKNEARVHLWREEKFGDPIDPYSSVEEAILSWGATITSIGVRLENNELIVYAPYGLNDIFSMIIRPVKKDFSKEYYEKRAKKWKTKWNKLEIIPWDL